GHFAEQPKFTRPPGCAPAASDFGFSGGRHDFRKQSIHRAEFRELAQAAKLLRSVVHRALVVAENGVIANAKLPRGSFLGSGDFSDGGCIKMRPASSQLGNALPELAPRAKETPVPLSLVMTVIGADRPGLVDSLAGLVAEQGGNWLESRMSRLGGQFAGILHVQVPAEKEAALIQSLKDLEREGVTIVVHSERPKPEPSAGPMVFLEIMGQDRPGIVHQISHALASHAVNVEDLDT